MKYRPTLIQELCDHPSLMKAGIRLLIKREDMNHPEVSGNKWWKLKYNLLQAINEGHTTLLTFGGAYSNHIYATAAACAELNLQCIGMIRGEETLPLNKTLQFAHDMGMKIHYVSRTEYRAKNSAVFLDKLRQRFGEFYLIPEGGSNLLAVKGCAEFAEQELASVRFDYVCLPVGTGGTMAGLICGLHDQRNVVGVSVIRDGAYVNGEVRRLVEDFSGGTFTNWKLLTEHHHGGYAKLNPELLSFIRAMREKFHLPLDHVYTGKLLWAVLKEAEAGSFLKGSTVLALHTGGLQGSIPDHV